MVDTTPPSTLPPAPAGRIGRRFAELRAQGEKALVTYVMAGDPDFDTSAAIVHTLAEHGADVVELGLPFSDPLADGPVIQAAGLRAQAAGINTGRVLDLVRRVRTGGCEVPLVIMTYYNPVLQRGLERFCAEAAAAGVDGLIVPDLPIEEADGLKAACDASGLALVAMLAPTSTPERIAAAARQANGFIYCVSMTGVTGAQDRFSDRFSPVVAAIRSQTAVPVVVGFGIATADQVRTVTAVADGAVVGSALVRICGAHKEPAAVLAAIATATRELWQGTRR